LNGQIRCILLLLLFSIEPLHSALAHPDDSSARLEAMVDSTINQTYNYRFDDALQTTAGMIAMYPEDPEGYLYRCGIYWKMMKEGCDNPGDSTLSKIKVLIDQACRFSELKLGADKENVKGLFYYAGALVYRAKYEMMKSDWFGVMADGNKARKLLEKAVAIDPHFYDAYSGIGAFNFYTANLPWYLRPIAVMMGISGNGELAVTQLKTAAQKGKYSKAEAADFLASVVYLKERKYDDAIFVMRNLHREYPGNLNFIRELCTTFCRVGRYTEAIHYADLALEHPAIVDTCCKTSLAYIRLYRGVSFEKLNQKDKAIADFEIVAGMDNGEYACKQAKEELDGLRRR
jgi:tetratricopeptide (TPR) repeat protein